MSPADRLRKLPPAEPLAPARSAYPLFLAGIGSWFTAWGMQTVLFQWLVVEELGESATRVGTAQMAVLLPSLLFLLVGGAVADRVDRRRALIGLHALAALACGGFGLLIYAGALSYGRIIAYALLMGTLQSFVVPTRDALLSEVVKARMSRAVAGLTMVQQGAQGVGALAAGLAGAWGAPLVLGIQSVVALLGALPMRGLPRRPRESLEPRDPPHLRELRAGVIEVARSPVLRAVMGLNLSVGLVFVGSYLVILPLLVRELYGGGAGKMGLLAAALPAGSIVVHLGIVARGGIVRQGRALLLGQGFAGLALGALAFGLPFWAAALATSGWGVGAAFAINASRTLFQEHSSDPNRGRVLSIYSLGILGAGPVGALLAGFLSGRIGTLATLALESAAMSGIVVATLLFTGVRRFR
ncbi:MAG: MFS transporter [Myxococcota bacterium]